MRNVIDSETIQVLLIEDDAADVRLIREMLLAKQNSRFLLQVEQTLEDGIRHVSASLPDIILLDLTLSDSRGLTTLEKLCQSVPDVPIIVLTGLDEATQVGVRAVQSGAQDYLVKFDVDPKHLRSSIQYAIERHQSERRLRQSEQEYRSLIDDVFDTSMVAVIILDRDLRIVWCNEATEVYFGVERAAILGRDKREVIDSELKCIFADPNDYAARLLHAYDTGTFSDRFECHVVPAGDRQERWLEHWSQPIRSGMFKSGRIEQYNDITDRKALQFAERDQREFAEALRDIATTLTSTLELKEVLGHILTNLDRIVPHDIASIVMVAGDSMWVARQRYRTDGDIREIVTERQTTIAYRQYLAQMADSQRPLLIQNTEQTRYDWPDDLMTYIRAYMGAPILLQNEIIGYINLLNQSPYSFHEKGLERLSAFAELAAIAIQNARLYHKSRQLAALEERQRLARDLHDSVSQTMFTCRAMLESALKRFESDPQRARELVQEVHQLAITALSEMRILLLELRPDTLTRVSLKDLFEQYLQPIQKRRQFALQITIEDVPPLPGEVQIALYRITQEALNNIDKHAQAANVRVNISQSDGGIALKICDDGTGFQVNAEHRTSMGLAIMHERAAEIGAELQVDSAPGRGTCVSVRWRGLQHES